MIMRNFYIIGAFLPLCFGLNRWPRDAPANLQTTDVPLTFDSQRRYSVNVSMSSPDPQKFSFFLTTSTGYSLVAGASCTTCNDVPAYNQSLSNTAMPAAQDGTTINVSQGSASGGFVSENCTFSAANPPWVYPNQSILVANQSSSLFGDGVSGVLGLGTTQDNFNATVFANWLAQNPSHNNFSYGMALNRPSGSSSDGGVLHWLAPDPSFYRGDVAWKGMQSSNSSSGYDFQVTMDGWNFTDDTKSNSLNRSGTFPSVLDPYIPVTIIPQADATMLYANIPGSAVSSNDTSSSTIWEVPCLSVFSVSFIFDNVTLTLDQTSLVGSQQQNGNCVGTIEGWSSSQNEFLLGSNFLASAYVIFQIVGAANGQVGFANRSVPQNKQASAATMVGIILGGLSFVLALGIIGFLVYRHRKSTNGQKFELVETTQVRPYGRNHDFSMASGEQAGLLGSYTSPITPYHYTPVPTQTQSQTLVVPGAPSDRATVDAESPPPYAHEGTPPGTSNNHSGQSVRLSHGGETVIIGPPPSDQKRRRSTRQSVS